MTDNKDKIIELLKNCEGYCLIGFVYSSNQEDMAMATHINNVNANPFVTKLSIPTMEHNLKKLKEITEIKLQTTPSNKDG